VRWGILIVGWLGVIAGGLVILPTLSGHDQNLVAWSFVSGVLVARIVPRLWRWSDTGESYEE